MVKRIEPVVDITGVRDSVQQFAIEMEVQLRKNEWKGGWEDLPRRQIFQDLIDQAMLLWNAVQERNSERIKKKSADVANYAMMLYQREIMKREKNSENGGD